ncbi:MAG: hypothetical protein JXK94_09235 [Deltaproteobacteria bacterium]|nr:hypothetical protein [Deltaproteobacteria bacterium]
MKERVLKGIFALTMILTIFLFVLEKPVFPALFLGALILFIVYSVWDPPKKHKNFGYDDQQRAMRAFDRKEQLNFQKFSTGKKKAKGKRKI